jgi:hypothetical protein
LSIEPNSPVLSDVGIRRSSPAMGSTNPSEGSPRWPRTRSCSTCIRRTGSSMSSGIGKRAGTNWLPATSSVPAVRTLIGIVIRRASAGAPSSSW